MDTSKSEYSDDEEFLSSDGEEFYWIILVTFGVFLFCNFKN